ncbi:phage repressor protein CI [Vibrio parahaemolyticus]|uniref:phage repressor protein CI n=1 Tax=Vibrio parahaemolyticus TaxID=670 RepID=UPI00111D20BB|nr:phage repressor protein CI [Vibrio parahaemolyticus]EKQ5901677.1 phage repressor protein CI [Vibrio parahaemolyticus]ELA8135957.1 phage repressor protein CI [Vibrio parahaemolyticus]MCD1413377.1 phage repressor protein CI [Vibrio parahaemolyticus]MDF4475499.1 phage repressor protein CI [Vibrio parahaemolyticus]MDF4480109.1 phage repressor protein CI [Vibrio parahaemolyticus]
MSEYREQIPSFEYIGGRDVTERMKLVTKTNDFKSLGECLGVSKGTISTWHQRGLTPYEVIIRLHLRTGASIKYLALGEGEPFPLQSSQDHLTKKNESRTLFDIDVFKLVNGKLQGNETLPFDKAYLDKLGVLNVMGIEQDGSTYIIDKEVHQAVSGTYLVDMDGLFSLNEIQRLPGKKLAISFNGSTLTVEEDEVRVVGRVALVMEKK